MFDYIMTLVNSPLTREPHLALRKIKSRLGSRPAPGPRLPPENLRIEYPSSWNDALRSWFSACHVNQAPPAEQVFGRVFDRAFLLAICRHGPPHHNDITGDVKLAWDFARCHHAPLLAYMNAPGCAEQLAREASELMQCPGESPFWSSPMDVSIRAVNWITADVLLDGRLGVAIGNSWPGIIWQHLDLIWRHLEAFRLSSNHYLSNLLGLTVLGRSLPDATLAHRALSFSRREWPRALLAQTHQDGGAYEASLPYHAFVTEMALVARLFDPAPWPMHATDRLCGMVHVLRKHRTDSGGLPVVGDDDSGRVFAIDHGSITTRADALINLADRVHAYKADSIPNLFPASGWWVGRQGDWFVHAEFGGVGFHGHGAHAHDDDFSIWVEYKGNPIFADPGSYLYTPDRESRDLFRSAHYHTTVRLLPSDTEPQSIRAENTFVWAGRNKPLACNLPESNHMSICEISNETIFRRISLEPDSVSVDDHVTGSGDGWWFFHVHPGITATIHEKGAWLRSGQLNLSLTLTPNVPLTAVSGFFSCRYGSRTPSTILRARVSVRQSYDVNWKVEPVC
jgi:Heparinase II/III-like protein